MQVAVQAMQYVLQSRQDIFIDTGFKCSMTVENKSITFICHGNRLIISIKTEQTALGTSQNAETINLFYDANAFDRT